MTNHCPIIRTGKTLGYTAEYVKYNSRVKLYPNDCGEWEPVQQLVCSRFVFNPDGAELISTPPRYYRLALPAEPTSPEELQARSLNRARAKLFDYVCCNPDLNYFVTLTFDGEKVAREDYAEVVKKFNQWTSNAVRRYGLKYLGVVERHHQTHGLHFHLLTNSALELQDSGTVKCAGRKKPIKVATADRYKIPYAERKTVYNLPQWRYGFSTSIEIDGEGARQKVAHYVCKYLTKDVEKIGGRYYYHGGTLESPRYVYGRVDFERVEADRQFEIENSDIKYKVVYLNGSKDRNV